MRPWVRYLGILAAAVAAAGVTFWATTRRAPDPKAVVEAFERMAFDQYRPAEAARKYFSPDIIDHSQRVRGDFASIIELLPR